MHKVIEKKSNEIKFEITVDEKKLKAVTKLVSEELSKELNIDGFRPGKAPQFVVEKEVGKDQFWSKVIDKIVPEAYFEAILAEKVSAISQPKIRIKELVPGERLVFESETAILPQLKNLEYKNQKLKFKAQPVTEKEKKAALEGLAEKYSEEKEVSRKAKKGDKVEVDFNGTIKGIPFDGGSSKNHPIVLGSNIMMPGFEEKIINRSPGEEFSFNLTFPEDYHVKNLAGKRATFKVKLNKVFERIKPKIDDNFAKKINLKGLDELKEKINSELSIQKKLTEKRRLEEKIVEEVIRKNKIEAPKILLDEEIHRMVHEAEHNLSKSGLTMEKFLEMSNKTMEELHKDMEPEAKKRVQIGIALGEIARSEKIEVKENDINREIEKIVATATPGTNIEDLKAAYETPERRREIGNSLVIRRTVDRLWKYNVLD